jgi:predicted NUDIX family NTP pyrophosphohydrolase
VTDSNQPETGTGKIAHLTSAGIVLYRETSMGLRVLLAHPGGPYNKHQDLGAWTIPKGLIEPGEEPTGAALREFCEEVGWTPTGEMHPLGDVRLRSGKLVHGFALLSRESEESLLAQFNPGTFTTEWPPKSGQTAEFPEVDRVEFFSLIEATARINPAQRPFLDRLAALHDS